MKQPHDSVDLNRKGLKAKYFKNKNFGNAYKLIYDRHIRLQSTPSDEELTRLGIKKIEDKIPHSIPHLVQNIIDEYNKENFKLITRSIAETLTENGALAAKEVMQAGANLYIDLNKEARTKNIVSLNDEFWNSYLFRAEHKGEITGIPTGFHIFDNHTMGLQKQWLVTVSGRNGMNKTWVLSKWALSAWQRGNNVGIFSCEMSAEELSQRLHSLAANVPPTKVLEGTLTDVEKTRLKGHLDSCNETPFGQLIINDNPQSMSDVDNLVSEINEKTPLDIIFIDAAYRMHGTGDSDTSKQTSIARAAKDLAKKYNVPVVCSTQLNRDYAKANATDKGKEKSVSGGHYAYGTDGWNQDSDIFLMLNQPEIYQPYDYYDFILQKFRHGKQNLVYMLEINLLIPKVHQIDFEIAKARLTGAPPSITQKGEKIFDISKKVFQDNEDAINGDILKEFNEHIEKIKKDLEKNDTNDDNNQPPQTLEGD